jgi:hypothetical protein
MIHALRYTLTPAPPIGSRVKITMMDGKPTTYIVTSTGLVKAGNRKERRSKREK